MVLTAGLRAAARVVVAAGGSQGAGRMLHSALGGRAAALGVWPMAARWPRPARSAGLPRFLSMGGPIVESQKSLGAAATALCAAGRLVLHDLPALARA